MKKFTLRWIGSMHTGDEFELILQALEAGLDEGPLVVAPQPPSRGSGQRKASHYRAQVFENPDWLRAHFAEHSDDLDNEFWIGICENIDRRHQGTATAALWHFSRLLDELAGRYKVRSKPSHSAPEGQNDSQLTYGAITSSPQDSFVAILDNVGEAFAEVSRMHRGLPSSVLISRA